MMYLLFYVFNYIYFGTGWCALYAVCRLTLPSTLGRTVKWVSALGLSKNNKWWWWMWMVATIISGLTAQIDWLGLRTGSHSAFYLHLLNKLGEYCDSSELWWQHHKYCCVYYYYNDCYYFILFVIFVECFLKIPKRITGFYKDSVKCQQTWCVAKWSKLIYLWI